MKKRNETREMALPAGVALWQDPGGDRMLSIPVALDALNFLSADVRNLFGPFINVFLVTSQNWSQTDVGLHSAFQCRFRKATPATHEGYHHGCERLYTA